MRCALFAQKPDLRHSAAFAGAIRASTNLYYLPSIVHTKVQPMYAFNALLTESMHADDPPQTRCRVSVTFLCNLPLVLPDGEATMSQLSQCYSSWWSRRYLRAQKHGFPCICIGLSRDACLWSCMMVISLWEAIGQYTTGRLAKDSIDKPRLCMYDAFSNLAFVAITASTCLNLTGLCVSLAFSLGKCG